jgi:hypothetical protein
MVRRITIVGLIIYCMAISPAFAGTWRDDFEDGNLDGWAMFNPIPAEKWGVEDGECSGQWTPAMPGMYSPLQLHAENADLWEDYTVTFKAKLVESFGKAGGGACFFGITFRMPIGRGMATYQALIAPESNEVVFYEEDQETSVVSLPFDILEDTWYELKVVAEGDHFEFYIDNELIESFDDDSFTSGGIDLGVANTHVHFDDVVITGPEIPNGGPGFAVTAESKLATMWGSVKLRP